MIGALRNVVSRDFADIRGTAVTGSIPLNEDLINQFLNAPSTAKPGSIQEFHFRIGSNNRVEAGMRVTIGPFSQWLKPQLVIDANSASGQSPVLRFKVEAGYGMLARLVQTFVKGRFLAGIAIQESLITVDFSQLPQTAPYRRLFSYLKQLRVSTRPGVMTVEFELRVD